MNPSTVVLFLSLFSAPEELAACPLVTPTIIVNPAVKGMTVDHTRSRMHLARMMNGSQFEGFSMQGLTVLDYTTSYKMSVSMTEIAKGRWCASLERVTAEFGLKTPAKVLIAKEIRKGTCEYRTVLDHERDHVAVGERNARAGAAAMQVALTRLAGKAFPVEGRSKDEVYILSKKMVDDAVGVVAAEAIARADLENAAMDTRESYEKLSKMCR